MVHAAGPALINLFSLSADSCTLLVPLTLHWNSVISTKSWYGPIHIEATQTLTPPQMAKGVKGFANETNALVGADLLISITDFIGSLILIYRCWLLWSRNYWVIILPSLISIASLGKALMTMAASWCSPTIFVSVCFSVVLYLLLRINPNSPMAPPSLVPLGLAAFSLPLGTNVIVTTLLAGRIWYLSPHKARNMGSAQFPTRTRHAAIDIVIESGMLYLAVQFVFVILFAIRHPAQGIVGVIAVQIYVRIPHPWEAENSS